MCCLDKRFLGGVDFFWRLFHAGMVGFWTNDGAAVGAWQIVDTQDSMAFAIGIPHAGWITGGEQRDAWLAERCRQMHDACVITEIAIALRHDGGGYGERSASDERTANAVAYETCRDFCVGCATEEKRPDGCLRA